MTVTQHVASVNSTTPMRSRANRRKSNRRRSTNVVTPQSTGKRKREDDDEEHEHKAKKLYHQWDALGKWDIVSCDKYSRKTLTLLGNPVVQIKQTGTPTGKAQFCACSCKIEVIKFDEAKGVLEFRFKGTWEYDKYSGVGTIELNNDNLHEAKMKLEPKLADECEFILKKSKEAFDKIHITSSASKWK